jgi:Cu/Zn superoxide dismutase
MKGDHMNQIQLTIGGKVVYTHDTESTDSIASECEPTQTPHTLPDDAVVECQVRKSRNGVYLQARFAKGDRQSVNLVNVDVHELVQTKEKSEKTPRLSFAGTGNHFYTSAFLNGNHVFADGIHIGDLPVGWGEGRK